MLVRSGKYTKSFDLTKQDEDAKNPRDVHRTIDNTFVITIPIADGFDNGIEPEVKKWIIIEDSIYL